MKPFKILVAVPHHFWQTCRINARYKSEAPSGENTQRPFQRFHSISLKHSSSLLLLHERSPPHPCGGNGAKCLPMQKFWFLKCIVIRNGNIFGALEILCRYMSVYASGHMLIYTVSINKHYNAQQVVYIFLCTVGNLCVELSTFSLILCITQF